MALLPDFLIIEVCVDSVESAIAAAKAGADRLEVCAQLGAGGGTTPTVGLVKSIQRAVDLSLMVIIRPRVGDFLYSSFELEVILEDIRAFKELGNIRGFVVGALTKDGQVDIERMKLIIDEILPLEVCFHRAFDMTVDPMQAMTDIADIGGISRILTSGHSSQVLLGLPVLQKLFNRRNELVDDEVWGLTLMPGSGINGKTLPDILGALMPLGLREIHLSGGQWLSGDMTFRKNGMGMGTYSSTEWDIWCTQEDEVRNVRQISDTMWQDFVSPIIRRMRETLAYISPLGKSRMVNISC